MVDEAGHSPNPWPATALADAILAGRSPFPEVLPEPSYPLGSLLRKVNHKGCIRIQGRRLYLSKEFIGEQVTLIPMGDEIHVLFHSFSVARIDLAGAPVVVYSLSRRLD